MNAVTDPSILWAQGIVAPWYLRDDQLPIYELLLTSKNPFVECARRYGKTTSILCFVFEELLRNPGWVCRWCEPDKNQAREIVIEEVDRIQRFAGIPRNQMFRYNMMDSYFKHPNGSKIYLRGVNHDRGDSARGPTANIIVADEFGTWIDPDYIVTSALRPQLQTTRGPFIFASTPPKDLGHPYYDHKEWAMREKRFIQRTVYDNKSLEPERIAELINECRGEETSAWRREYLCEPVTDSGNLVISEYQEALHDVENDYPRPPYFDAYVGFDLGFNDNTAGVFGYYDFKKCELVIEEEFVANGRNSREITSASKAIEARLWGSLTCGCLKMPCFEHGKRPYMRWGDNDLQQLHDMATEHGYLISPTRKDDKIAAINALRLRFSGCKIKIKKRCKSLRYQLKVGLWNDRRTDFKRGEKTGHLDAIDALIYLSRNVNEHHNPYPQNDGLSIYQNYLPDGSQGNKENEALANLFTPFG